MHDSINAAAETIADADGLIITAGAGIGIDSGLPDFRGDHGFWKAYPALGQIGMRFYEIASPSAFHARPLTAWGFYGHRLQLYRKTVPHRGFAMLRDIAKRMPAGVGIFTSNVDGQFQKAGFADSDVMECHGSIHYLQCFNACGQACWASDDFHPQVDAVACALISPLPTCPACGGLARPNILMFNDGDWDDQRSSRQLQRLETKLMKMQRPVVVEIGAGTAIPTVRRFGEQLGCPLIRINPTEAAVVRHGDIAVAAGALAGVTSLYEALLKTD